jgi:hypothetical protein
MRLRQSAVRPLVGGVGFHGINVIALHATDFGMAFPIRHRDHQSVTLRTTLRTHFFLQVAEYLRFSCEMEDLLGLLNAWNSARVNFNPKSSVRNPT